MWNGNGPNLKWKNICLVYVHVHMYIDHSWKTPFYADYGHCMHIYIYTLVDVFNFLIIIFNPRCMCEDYGSHSMCVNVWLSVCVHVYVCFHATCYIPRLYVDNKVPLSFLLRRSQDMHYVDFVENALFKSSGDICWCPMPSSLLNELSVNKSNTVNCQLSFLLLLTWHTRGLLQLHVRNNIIAFNAITTFMWLYTYTS